jgi:fructokinase
MKYSANIDVVCVGEVLVDIFAENEAGIGCALSRAQNLKPILGGAPANVCVGLARQGVGCAMLGLVGQDGLGELLREQLEAEGVNASFLGSSKARTGLAFISRSIAGEPSYLFYRNDTADSRLDAPYIDRVQSVIAGAKMLHFCGNAACADSALEALVRAIEIAKQNQLLVSLDLNLRLHLWFSRRRAVSTIERLLSQVDIVKGSRQEALTITGQQESAAATRALLDRGPKLAIVTDGPAGASFCTSKHAGHVSAVNIEAIDATGAGDAFAAIVLAGLLDISRGRRGGKIVANELSDLSEQQLSALIARAHVAASEVCKSLGATSGIPTRALLDSLTTDKS